MYCRQKRSEFFRLLVLSSLKYQRLDKQYDRLIYDNTSASSWWECVALWNMKGGGGGLFLKHSLNFCIFMGPREWLIAWLSSTCCDPICHLPLTIPKNDTLLLYLTSLLHQMLSLQIKRTTLFGKCSNLFLSPPVPCLACALFVLSHGSSAHVASRAMKECNMSTFYRVDLRS